MANGYDNPWRDAYEIVPAATWAAAGATTVAAGLSTDLPIMPFVGLTAACFSMSAYRGKQAYDLLDFKTRLAGQPFSFIRSHEPRQKIERDSNKLWFGTGFIWKPIHTQRVMELQKRDIDELLPPNWYLKLRGLDPVALKDSVGTQWVHGIEPSEGDVKIPLSNLEGHTCVIGTTGAGKTRAAEVLIYQAVMRGDVLFVIDPKGDRDLENVVEQACKDAGRPEAFVRFHVAFPSKSIRLDCLKNFNRVTELATRVSSLMGTGDTFEDFAWRAVDQVVQAMLYLESRPSLRSLRRIIENGPESLLQELLKTFFRKNVPNWESRCSGLVAEARSDKRPTISPPELAGYIKFYQGLPDDIKHGAVDGLMNMTLHSREHLGKILASLMPVLAKLTTGELGDHLSPDYDDHEDQRPIFDNAKLINGRYVVYIGLDSLSDAAVGSALGSLILSDLASVAGDRYNYGVPAGSKIQLMVDECSEVANVPLIQLLNKGRGAGFTITLFTQTMHDLIERLGSQSAAYQMLGNTNNLVALRTSDVDTQKYVAEKLGETTITKVSRGHSTGSRTDDGGLEFTGSVSESLSEERVAIFPVELLGKLPNLHYIALIAGGRLIKGRLSKVTT